MTGFGLLASSLLRDRSGIPLDLDFERSGRWKSWTTPKG